MKSVVLIFACIAICGNVVKAQVNNSPANATQPTADPDAGVFKFVEGTHDYGVVPEGPFAECDFVFKNTGKKPIIITESHGSCGCTVPDCPVSPFAR